MILFTTILLLVLSLGAPTICGAQKIRQPIGEVAPQKEFVYRLPYAKRISATAMQQSAIAAHHYHEDNLVGFTCWKFSWQNGNGDVYAVRKGVVSQIGEYVEVIHADGTASRYAGVAYESLRVKKGDMVWPDTIIGEAAKDENGNFCMELELYYLTPRPEGHRTRASYLRHYIDPLFSTTRGTIQLQKGKSYKAKANKKLIVKEK